MKRITAAAVIAIAMCMALASQAYASTLTWNLADVEFADGGTATGSFGYDADTDTFSNFNIVTTNGDLFGGTTYSDASGLANERNLDFRSPIANSVEQYRFAFPLASQMKNTGGTINFKMDLITFELLCPDVVCNMATPVRQITGGSIIASPVPVPAALPLMLSALGVFGYLGWRRKRLTAA